VLEALGKERLRLIETAGTDDRVDQHLLEEIALRRSRATRDLLKSFGWGIAALHHAKGPS
jgi:hypothetical protein